MTTSTPNSIRSVPSSFWKRGEHFVWLTGGALAVCLFMIVLVVGIILVNGSVYFWPRAVTLYQLKDGSRTLAMLQQKEKIPPAVAKEQGLSDNPWRRLVMVGNRDLYGGIDFVWINDQAIASSSSPAEAWVVDRHEYGKFIGYIKTLDFEGKRLEGVEAQKALPGAISSAQKMFRKINQIEKHQIGEVNARIEKLRLEEVKVQRLLTGAELASRMEAIQKERLLLQPKYEALVVEVNALRTHGNASKVTLEDVKGMAKDYSLLGIMDAWQPNQMGITGKLSAYFHNLYKFLFDDPREANTEGGIFPAMFGTAVMVMLMTLAVVPFGVLTAFYLCEYAKQGPFVRAVRIALNNLAGVPSIVYGVFGLGFFVYFLGGNIDRLFYPDALPAPTWGTGGIFWASLTLALLTVPVVVMSTEESISAVPRGMREGSLALGASKFQTLIHILLPASLPGILTGVILAMARGAGEVAPLMITGVVKLAPSLPIDGTFPYFHLERKFMHLGFHIFDVGFQSPNIEASRPMVFTTALLLVLLVVALNLGAIILRDRVRKRFATGAFN